MAMTLWLVMVVRHLNTPSALPPLADCGLAGIPPDIQGPPPGQVPIRCPWEEPPSPVECLLAPGKLRQRTGGERVETWPNAVVPFDE
jgi:hypothetical protein